MTFTTAKNAATDISNINVTGFQGRTLNLTPNAREAPRVGRQWDANREGARRRSGQSQGNTKTEPSMPKSNHKATMAKTKRTGESGKTHIRILGYPDTKNNVKIGLQRDATAEGEARRDGQSQGNTKAEPPTPKSNYKAMMTKTKRIGESGRTSTRNLGYSDTENNVKKGFQRDATAKEGSPRPNGQANGSPTEIQTIGKPERVFIANLDYSTTDQ